ncbi:MAG: hypothetical protein VXW24_04665, partial [Bacteroidota bacterium]|nr:hypothetical protein [Bacteroidota bacterium]
IEKAITNPKANVKEKTWRYRGMIYNNVAMDTALSSLYPDALVNAISSYQTARSLDVKGRYADDHDKGLNLTRVIANELAMNAWGVENYEGSAGFFKNAIDAAVANEVVDSTAMSNYALALEKNQMFAESAEAYLKCARIGFNQVQSFLAATDAAVSANNRPLAFQIIAEAKEYSPGDQGILITEFNLFVEEQSLVDEEIELHKQAQDVKGSGDEESSREFELLIDSLERKKETLFEAALTSIMSAANNDSTNAALWVQSGIILGELGLRDESISALSQAISADSMLFDAHYMLGTTYYNDAAKIDEAIREKYDAIFRLTKSQQADKDRMKDEMSSLFQLALPSFMKSYEINPKDCDTLAALQTIYGRLGNTTKEEAIYAERKVVGCR